jgi:hypothetical protein
MPKYNSEERKLARQIHDLQYKAKETELKLCGYRYKILELQKELKGKYAPRQKINRVL